MPSPDPYERLEEEARALGVSRLADVTGLDELGVPVWQAVRPWGRSLSVHQGKGPDARSARIGALMEAVECSRAEAWVPAQRLTASHAGLPRGERSPANDDFSRVRGRPPEGPIDWAPAEIVLGGGLLWVPVRSVSLDLTSPAVAGLECTSNGQGAGFEPGRASLKAVCELIERDAYKAWADKSLFARALDAVDTASIPFGWFRDMDDRFRAMDILIRVYALPAVIDCPVFAAELLAIGDSTTSRLNAAGTCAHPSSEAALQGAVLEAAQARLTQISGARDDLDPAPPPTMAGYIGFAPPPPPGSRLSKWGEIATDRPNLPAGDAFRRLVEQLAEAGYAQTARVTLSPLGSPVSVVKLFTPGLGAFGRSRRAPLH